MKTVVVGGVFAAILLALAPGTASANLLWCLSDPPEQTTTSGGTNLVVNTTLYAPAGEKKDLSAVTEDVVTTADGAGGSLVTVYVFVPASISQLTVVAQVQRYNVTATGSGPGGSEIVLTLDVPVS